MLKWLYFTLATVSLTYGLAGWASHFLMPARTLYAVTLGIGIPAGIIVTLIPWGRYAARPLLFALWPIAVTTVFFTSLGTFDFAEVAYVDLLNYEFALIWAGALYAVIVFYPRKRKVFDEGVRKHTGWQTPVGEMAASQTIPRDLDSDIEIPGRETRDLPRHIGDDSYYETDRHGKELSGKGRRNVQDAILPFDSASGWITIEEAMKQAEEDNPEE